MKEIEAFSEMYSSNRIILSSRPDTGVASWRRFQNFRICELNINQAEKIIKRIPRFDDDKKRFIPELRESLFEKHKTFVVNPLLLSIYFISYCRNSKVSQKISAFYKNAYEALFELHDLRKEGFQREMYAGLDLQDFERAFSAFCMITFAERSLQFSRPDSEKYAEAARSLIRKHFPSIDYKPSELILDAEKSVALLSDDNGILEFSHRSFQEYFVSVFINYCNTDTQEKILHKLLKDGRVISSDNVLNILYELNPILVEKMFIIPNLKKFAESCGLRNKVGITHHKKFIRGLTPFLNPGELINTEQLTIFFKIVNLIEPNLKTIRKIPETGVRMARRGGGYNMKVTFDGIAIPSGYRDLFEKESSIFSGSFLQEVFDFMRQAEKRSSDEEFSISTILEL